MAIENCNALEEHTCPECGCMHKHRFAWDWGKFVVGKMSNKFIAWTAYMVLQFVALFLKIIPDRYTGTLLWVTAIVTFIFMLAGAIDQAVANAKITAEFKASLLKELKGG